MAQDLVRQFNIDELFNDFRMFSLFKEWMESKHAAESVTAYVWLHKLKRMWAEFFISPLRRRFINGEYEPRIVKSRAKRFKLTRLERRESDELIIEHFKQKSGQ
jgi:hypothetical protein